MAPLFTAISHDLHYGIWLQGWLATVLFLFYFPRACWVFYQRRLQPTELLVRTVKHKQDHAFTSQPLSHSELIHNHSATGGIRVKPLVLRWQCSKSRPLRSPWLWTFKINCAQTKDGWIRVSISPFTWVGYFPNLFFTIVNFQRCSLCSHIWFILFSLHNSMCSDFSVIVTSSPDKKSDKKNQTIYHHDTSHPIKHILRLVVLPWYKYLEQIQTKQAEFRKWY